MAKWIEYTGSIKNLEDIIRHHGKRIAYKYHAAEEPLIGHICKDAHLMRNVLLAASHYLICDPHPYANEIKIWSDTGCDVFIKSKYVLVLIVPTGANYDLVKICKGYSIYKSCAPDWNIPGAEYQLTPFEN